MRRRPERERGLFLRTRKSDESGSTDAVGTIPPSESARPSTGDSSRRAQPSPAPRSTSGLAPAPTSSMWRLAGQAEPLCGRFKGRLVGCRKELHDTDRLSRLTTRITRPLIALSSKKQTGRFPSRTDCGTRKVAIVDLERNTTLDPVVRVRSHREHSTRSDTCSDRDEPTILQRICRQLIQWRRWLCLALVVRRIERQTAVMSSRSPLKASPVGGLKIGTAQAKPPEIGCGLIYHGRADGALAHKLHHVGHIHSVPSQRFNGTAKGRPPPQNELTRHTRRAR